MDVPFLLSPEQMARLRPFFGPWTTLATRYDRCPHLFLAAITLAATVIFWLTQ